MICEISQNFTFLPSILSFCINKHLLMISLMEECSVEKNNNEYKLCQTEYTVLFAYVKSISYTVATKVSSENVKTKEPLGRYVRNIRC